MVLKVLCGSNLEFLFISIPLPPLLLTQQRMLEKWEWDMAWARLTPASLRAQQLLRIVSKCSAHCVSGSD